MKLAFELATFNSLWPYGAIDRIISWWTQSKFCHVELVFDHLAPDLTFSATKSEGVRFGKITDLDDPKHWVLIDVPVSREVELQAYEYALTLVGRKYNTIGLFRFAFGPIKSPKSEAFCSQVCLTVLQHNPPGLFPGDPADRVDPGFLYDLVTAVKK